MSQQVSEHQDQPSARLKVCCRCKETLPLASFYVVGSGKTAGKPYSFCKACSAKRAIKYREIRKESSRRWYDENTDRARAKFKAWATANRAYNLARRRAYYAANRDESLQRSREWRIQHPERWNDLMRAHRAARRSREEASGGKFSPDEWASLKAQYGNACLCCGRTDLPLAADHVVPVKLGGTSDIRNIQPLCRSCNSKKGTKIIDYRDALRKPAVS